MIRLNCFFKANEEAYTDALEVAIALTAHSQGEEGCIAYDVFESATRGDVFMICETWADAEALAAHSATDFYKESVAQLGRLGQLKLEQFDFGK